MQNQLRFNWTAFRILALLLITFSADRAASAEDQRPNILFIFTDDQNYKTLSCYPESPDWVSTPNIDDLASRGVRFERTYFGAWCMPSRASFLTGRLQHGVQTMRMEGKYPRSVYDPEKCRFWPAELRKHGYHTAQIGKWHTGIDTGYSRDWDHQIVWNRPGQPDNAGHYFYDQIVTFDGVDKKVEGYSTDNYTNWAIDYIRGQHREETKPWFLWLCYGAIHGPTTPADRHKGLLSGKQAVIPDDIFGPWPTKPKYLDDTASWQAGQNGRAVRRNKSYDASNFNTNTPGQSFDDWVQQSNECAMAIDEGVGRLIATLRETGQIDNTLIVFAADQGFALGEHGMNNKVAPYDATVASPMIIVHPKSIPQGKTCKHPVNAPDVVRFMASAAKIEIPWRTDGRDIRPLISDPENAQWNSDMLMTHTGRKYGADTDVAPNHEALYEVGGIPWYVLLRQGKYKYVRYFVEGEMEEIYDLQQDPEELTNLALVDESRDLLLRLRSAANEELQRTGAKFIDSLPPTKAMMKTR
ncbi:MAG: sulfatase-like hydrolase/transferase [Planctomycetales bacterium]|nr:sulfatase-like hydrolase/transferase [Planctomycetales bacterium]